MAVVNKTINFLVVQQSLLLLRDKNRRILFDAQLSKLLKWVVILLEQKTGVVLTWITWRWRCVEVGVSSTVTHLGHREHQWSSSAVTEADTRIQVDCLKVLMASPLKTGFHRLDIQKTTWDVPDRYTSLKPVGSGAYGTVWWVSIYNVDSDRNLYMLSMVYTGIYMHTLYDYIYVL